MGDAVEFFVGGSMIIGASIEQEALVVGIVCIIFMALFIVAGVKQKMKRDD